MPTWSTSVPLITNDISNDLTSIRENFGIIGTAWSGDHTALATDGSASTTHKKVTLVAAAAAAPVALSGVLYVDSGNSNDLFYAYPTGGSYATVRLTQSGVTPGQAYAFCTVPNLGTIKLINPKNVTSVVAGSSTGGVQTITVNFNTLAISTITAITTASPAQVTTAAAHGLETGATVLISGITGDGTAMSELNNQEFVITKIDATNFTIGAALTGTWTGGGSFSKAYTFMAYSNNSGGGFNFLRPSTKYVNKIELSFWKFNSSFVSQNSYTITDLNFVLFVN